MKILVINAGSSSLKYQLIDMQDESVIAKGLVERIGIEGSKLTHKYDGKEFELTVPMKDHSAAMKHVLDALMDAEHGVIKSIDEIGAVGHRVLHGGDKFTASCIIDQPCLDAIEECIPLGPLHNPANLMGIRACQSVMPGTPMVAVFDTAFHQTMPKTAYMYGVPYEFYEKYHIRRYGFHGTSHRFVSARAIELLGLKGKESKIIVCHLGNGSSLSAVVNGKCVDTSMGITPLEGVIMGTRSGSLDPAVLQFIMNNAKDENGNPEIKNIDEMLEMLNKKSGLLGLSGISSDMRDIDAAADQGDRNASIARDMLIYGIRKYIGAYAAAMNGVDVIVFTAGIGENGIEMREKVMEGFEFLGAKIDVEKNRVKGEERDISAADSKVKVLVIPTNEEIVIARDTLHLVTGK